MTAHKAVACALILAIGFVPPAASAQRRGGGGGGGGGARAGGAQAAQSRQAPASGGGGFNLSHDTGRPTSTGTGANRASAQNAGAARGTRNAGANGDRTAANANRSTNAANGNRSTTAANGNRSTNAANGNRSTNAANVDRSTNAANVNRNTANANRNVNVSGNTVNRTVVANPVYRGPAWGWNGGAVWAPRAAYYGGGFWGALAITATAAAVYGSITNSATQQTYNSYQVQQNSPGSTLLSNYGLTQTQCGGQNLVVIYGPSNSVICAIPNGKVTAGEYTVDPSNLSIVSQ